MVCIELNLTWAVEEHIVVSQLFKAVLEPFHIVFQLFKRIKNTAIGSQLVVRHDLLQGNKVANVERAWVVGVVVRRVEVDY